ncbi:MAG: hypothetical protein ACT4N4_11500 [Rhodospirillales bacterium]
MKVASLSHVPIAGLAAAFLLIAGARAEAPLSHARDTARYAGSPPVPGEIKPGPPAAPPAAAAAKPPASGPSPLDDPEYRFGQGKPRAPSGPRETVDGKPLWNTGDDPTKRGPFAFMGNKIGDPLDKLFPHPNTETDKYGMLLCRETPGVPGFLDCADDELRQLVDGTWQMRYRGVEVSFLNYRYLDRKLVGFDLGFPAAVYPKLVEVLERQYGPAHSKAAYDWRNLRGAGHDVKMLTWNTPHGSMVLSSHGAALDSGLLSLIEPVAEQRYADLRFKQTTPDAPAAPAKPQAPYDPYDR